MRAVRLTRYHFARHERKILIYVLIALIISLSSALFILPYTESRVMVNTGDTVVIDRAHVGMAMYEVPAEFTSPFLFTALVALSALWLTGRERKFLVSMSVTRRELLLCSLYYLVLLSVILTIAQFAVAIVGRGVMWIAGFAPRGGWTVEKLVTGGPGWAERHLSDFTVRLRYAGVYTLIGYLFARWWKVIVIAFASGVALLIVLISQVNLIRLLPQLFDYLTWLIPWIFTEAIPAVIDYLTNSSTWEGVAVNLVICLGAFALSYPVMRRMPVVK